MIKTAITGADSDEGGELIRILAMHPEVEMTCAQAAGLDGIPVTSRHHGLIGETDLRFSSKADLSRCDVLFVCGGSMSAAEFMDLRLRRPELRIICLEPIPGVNAEASGIVYGLPEINRKLLVRGATASLVPASLASMALVTLYPLALNLLLSGDIDISIAAPEQIVGIDTMERVQGEIETTLRDVQKSFTGSVRIKAKGSPARRSALMEISIPPLLDRDTVLKLYDIYDDHHFTFAVGHRVGVSEVAGTNKCIISVLQPEKGRITLCAAADCRLRGGAGEAVHAMNLMFGLHERTGLALKAIDYTPIE